MDELIEFIRAQLDDDERVAREALHEDAVLPGEWMTEHHNSKTHAEPNCCHIAEDRGGHYWSVAHEVFIPNAEHMARWDPARVLAEIDAKRQVLDALQPEARGNSLDARFHAQLIRLLALPYADREGYRESWRP